MSLVCGERCGEKRRVAPDRVLPADPQVVAGVYRQRRDVLQELLVFDLLLAELVEGLQPSATPLAPTSKAVTWGVSSVMSVRK